MLTDFKLEARKRCKGKIREKIFETKADIIYKLSPPATPRKGKDAT